MRELPIWQLGYARHEEENERESGNIRGGYRCSVCGCGRSDMVSFGTGDRVCGRCREGYLQERAAEFSEEYLVDNQEDFFAYIEERLM